MVRIGVDAPYPERLWAERPKERAQAPCLGKWLSLSGPLYLENDWRTLRPIQLYCAPSRHPQACFLKQREADSVVSECTDLSLARSPEVTLFIQC